MSPLVIDLVIKGDLIELPCFHSQGDLEEYLGEKTSANFDDEDEIFDFIDLWEKEHKFSVISDNIAGYDLEDMYAIRSAVFTLDNKYYRLFYRESYCNANQLEQGPYEVYPVEKTIIEYIIKK